MFLAAVAAVESGSLVKRVLVRSPEGIAIPPGDVCSFARWSSVRNVYLVGGGKAGRAMGEAAAGILGEKVSAGAIAVPRGKGGEAGPVRFIEAGHPYPDEGSREAAAAMLRLLSMAGDEDLVVALLSGGGSSMISLPPEGISPEEKEAATRLLLDAGAGIAEINAVRKHLSLVKGGYMARAAHPARVFALLLSDVPDDDPSVIASGPFSPDPTSYVYALDIVARMGILARLPSAVLARLEAGRAGAVPETPKPGDPAFARVARAVIGSNRNALEAASAAAKREGAGTVGVLPGFLRGEARECAGAFVAQLRKASATIPVGTAAVLVAGGETAVEVRGGGKGGRCQEFALSAAIGMDGEEGIAVLCAGTDGIDGPTPAAGAFADGSTCPRAAALGLSPRACLEGNDSHSFFRALSDLVVTGPTGTNVADIAIGVVLGKASSNARRSP
ncbi:MAG: glycerate 2-kinase [Actinobacteria bacterium]|nr:glycerate 2-kinase [Actinomycetota bacterium]